MPLAGQRIKGPGLEVGLAAKQGDQFGVGDRHGASVSGEGEFALERADRGQDLENDGIGPAVEVLRHVEPEAPLAGRRPVDGDVLAGGSNGVNGSMARKPRIVVPGGWYRVVNRGNRREAVFRSDTDRQRFLGRLAELYRGIPGLKCPAAATAVRRERGVSRLASSRPFPSAPRGFCVVQRSTPPASDAGNRATVQALPCSLGAG